MKSQPIPVGQRVIVFTALSSFLGTVLSQQDDIYNIRLDNGKEYLYSRTEIERHYRGKNATTIKKGARTTQSHSLARDIYNLRWPYLLGIPGRVQHSNNANTHVSIYYDIYPLHF